MFLPDECPRWERNNYFAKVCCLRLGSFEDFEGSKHFLKTWRTRI